MASPRQRPEVRDGHVGVAVRNFPAADAQQLDVGVLFRVRHALPVFLGHRHGLGPTSLVGLVFLLSFCFLFILFCLIPFINLSGECCFVRYCLVLYWVVFGGSVLYGV